MTVFAQKKLAPETYQNHALHDPSRDWPETNCYIDVWIELLHGFGFDPVAMLPVVFGVQFDGDQFTFYKPSHDDITDLYGIEIRELNVWKGLLPNALEQLEQGRIVLTETNAFYLPDTAGSDYRKNFVKTTIGIQEIDLAARTCRYFHNKSLYTLSDDDFVQTFRVNFAQDPLFMPFFAETVKFEGAYKRPARDLARLSLDSLKKQLARMPTQNPAEAFSMRFEKDLPELVAKGMGAYHGYAFATIRQFGSAFELGADYLKWLQKHGEPDLELASHECRAVSEASKMILLKLARSVASKRPLNFSELLEALGQHWKKATSLLQQRYL